MNILNINRAIRVPKNSHVDGYQIDDSYQNEKTYFSFYFKTNLGHLWFYDIVSNIDAGGAFKISVNKTQLKNLKKSLPYLKIKEYVDQRSKPKTMLRM